MNKLPMLNQEQIHRYFNHLSGAKRIEFLYGLLHLCQPLELRYLGTCLEEIARKDYEYLYHAEQKTNHLPPSTNASSTHATDSSNSSSSQVDLSSDEKLDLTDQITRAHAIVDIALLWAKNRQCAVRLFRRLKASESVKLVDMLLERDDLDERVMDEILIIFCLAANHPAFSFDMRTQMSQTLKELEKRERRLKSLKTNHNPNVNDDENVEMIDDSNCLRHHNLSTSMLNSSTLSVHASPLLTRLTVVNFDTESNPMRILIKADWSDTNSTYNWKTPNDIRSFHLQLSNAVYHDDIRLERLMNISSYLRDTGTAGEPDIEAMKKSIGIYMAHLVYFSSYISTISTLAKFFNSSLKLIDSKPRLYNSSNGFDDSVSSSTPYSNGITPLQCDLPVQQSLDAENKTLSSPKLSSSSNSKPKVQTDVAKQARSTLPTHNGTQTGLEVRSEGTQTDRIPGPGYILAEHQDYLRRYSMEELAKLKPADLIADGLDPLTSQSICGALDDLKPMSIHLSSNSKASRSPSNFLHMPPSSSSVSPPPPPPPPSAPLPPLLDAALMAVVQQQQSPGAHASLSSSPSPKLPKATPINGLPAIPTPIPLPTPLPTSNGPTQAQHHLSLLAAHPFLYNPVEPYIFPITIPPGFPSTAPDFMRLFAPNLAAMPANATNPNPSTFVNPSNVSQGSVSTSRSASQTNGANTPPEPNGPTHHVSPPLNSSNSSTRQPNASQTQQQGQQQPSSSTSSSGSHQPSQQQQQSIQQQQQQAPTHSHPQQQQQQHHHPHHHHQSYSTNSRFRQRPHYPSDSLQYQQNGLHSQQQNSQQRQSQSSYSQASHPRTKACYTCGDIGHLAFACPEQYSTESSYSHPNTNNNNNRDGYKLDYRPQQSTPTNLHQQQRQMRSNSNSKTKLRDNS